MKAEVVDDVHDTTVLVSVSVYNTKPFHFISMCCNTVKQVQKKRQVYGSESDMVRDAHFLLLNVNDSYNHNINSVDLSDQLQNV